MAILLGINSPTIKDYQDYYNLSMYYTKYKRGGTNNRGFPPYYRFEMTLKKTEWSRILIALENIKAGIK